MEAKRRKHGHGVSLPEDIVFDVLARLPAKTLCRLRCVCKGWRALISDPAFVTAQRSRAADPHLVGVFLGPRHWLEVRVMDMDGNVVKAFEITRSKLPQLHTRPDLICTAGDGLISPYGGVIVDPAAGQAFAAFGATDQSDCRNYYSTSIGRATPSGVLKVLRLWKQYHMNDLNDGGGQQICEVATIMDGNSSGITEPLTWRRKSAPPFDINNFQGCVHNKAIVNGVVYFIHQLDIDGDVDEGDDAAPSLLSFHIFAFDLESEEWKSEVINGPTLEYHEGEIWSVALVNFNGTLALVHEVTVIVNRNRYPNMSIWLLVDPDRSVWVKEYMIPLPKNQTGPAKLLGVLVDGRILLWSSVFEDEETRKYNRREVVLFYDPSTKAFTDFVEMGEEFRLTLVCYTGSLLS